MADNADHRSFTPSGKAKTLSFDIAGEQFNCATFVPGSVLMQHQARLTSSDAHVQATELLTMWDDVLGGEAERFRKFVDDPANLVSLQDLGEILEWALEQLTERPTRPSSRSSRGRAKTGATS